MPAIPGSADRITLEDGDYVEHEDVAHVEADGNVYKPPDLATREHAQVKAENGDLRQPDCAEVK